MLWTDPSGETAGAQVVCLVPGVQVPCAVVAVVVGGVIVTVLVLEAWKTSYQNNPGVRQAGDNLNCAELLAEPQVQTEVPVLELLEGNQNPIVRQTQEPQSTPIAWPGTDPQPQPTAAPTPTPEDDDLPVFISGQNTPETTQHIADAIAGGQPSTLTYLGSNSQLHHSRDWLDNDPRCQDAQGRWCDEYPFASTAEGGQANNSSLRLVPAREQQSQGGSLRQFYRRCNIVAGTKFKVATSRTARTHFVCR
jgi:hypothetical protein